MNQLHLKVWRLWCSLVKPCFLPEHLIIVYFSPPQLPFTHTPAIHTLLSPSVAVSSGHTPCHLSHLIGVLSQLSSGSSPLLLYHVPKTWQAQSCDTRDYTSQGVRLTGCWIVFGCLHYHVRTPEPYKKKKNRKWALLLGTVLNTIHTIPYNPIQPTQKVGFIISRRRAIRLKRWNSLPASQVMLDIFHLLLQIHYPICSLCQSMTISVVPLAN